MGHCMVNHTSSMLGVMGFEASAASPAPQARAPKAQLLENFTHFQTNRNQACVLDFKVECDSRLPRMLFWMVFLNRPLAMRPWCPSNVILAWPSMLVHGVEKHRQAHTHMEATEAHTKPQRTTTTQRRTHHTTRQQQSTTWCTQERSSPPDTTTKNEAPHHNTTHEKLAHHSTTPEELAHHKRRANAMWFSPQPKTEDNFFSLAKHQHKRSTFPTCRSNKIQFAQSSDLPGRTQNQTFGTSSEQSMQNTKAV